MSDGHSFTPPKAIIGYDVIASIHVGDQIGPWVRLIFTGIIIYCGVSSSPVGLPQV